MANYLHWTLSALIATCFRLAQGNTFEHGVAVLAQDMACFVFMLHFGEKWEEMATTSAVQGRQ